MMDSNWIFLEVFIISGFLVEKKDVIYATTLTGVLTIALRSEVLLEFKTFFHEMLKEVI